MGFRVKAWFQFENLNKKSMQWFGALVKENAKNKWNNYGCNANQANQEFGLLTC